MVIGKRFQNQRVIISGSAFEHCVFSDCELVFDGRPTRLVGNTFDHCGWSFEGAAGNTVDFAAALCRDSGEFSMTMARTLGIAGARPN